MKKLFKLSSLILIMAMMFINVGCNSFSGEEGTEIIDAKEALNLFNQENVVVVDAQGSQGYKSKHVKGAVNITRADIVINEPVANMLAPKEQIEEVMSKNGISNDDTVVIYGSNNNMDSARLWWTLKVYGHENIKVVSGGLYALRDAGVEFTEEIPNVSPTKYVAKDKDTTMIATKEEVKSQVNDPKKNVMLIDTRTQKEYNAGTIPGSVLMNYIDNNEFNGTFKSVSDIQVRYLDEGLIPEDTAIMYCKTSIRGAQTYLALYNAGYRNLKLYDGAWVEWSKDSSLPVQMPEKSKIEINEQDIS